MVITIKLLMIIDKDLYNLFLLLIINIILK